jgi:hypothetical protein
MKKETMVQIRHALAGLIFILAVSVLTSSPASADTVLYDNAGFIQGQQSFTESFDITTPGTLTITLTDIPWLDTLSNLTCFLTSSSGNLGQPMGSGSVQMAVGAGTIFAHWFGDASGQFGIGVFGLKIEFQPNATPVPLPSSLILMLSGLGLLLGWQRRKDYGGVAA